MADLDRHLPMPVLTVNGTDDPIVPFEGGTASAPGSGSRGEVLSSFASAALLAARNGITAAPTVEQLTKGATPTQVTRWRQPGCLPVDFLAVGRGGHTVPSRDHSARPELGRTARDLDAGELVGDFFGLVRSPPRPH
jgi:polyhydroxybutyrate depolymerase